MQGWTSGKESKYIQSFQVSYGTSRLSMSLYEDIPGTVKVGGTLAGWLWVPGGGGVSTRARWWWGSTQMSPRVQCMV